MVEFVDIYGCVEGFDIREWLGSRCFVLSLAALSEEPKDFVLNHIITSIQDWMKQSVCLGVNLVISVDEAHRFLSPIKSLCYDLGDPIILDAVQTFRKQGSEPHSVNPGISKLACGRISQC